MIGIFKMGDRSGLGTFVTDSTELGSEGVDFFAAPEVFHTYEKGFSVEYKPNNAITDQGPYEFIIPKDPEHYIQLNMTRLSGTLKVIKEDGTGFTDTEKMSVCNLFPQSIIKQIEVEVEGTQVNDISSSTYAQKAFIESVLTYGLEAKNTHLKMAGWESDGIGFEDSAADENIGWKTRKTRIVNKKNYHFNQLLHCDFLQCNRFLLPNVGMLIRISRNADDFSFMTSDTPTKGKIKVSDLTLHIRKIRINPDIDRQIESKLSNTPAMYPISQCKIRAFNMNKGTSRFTIPNVLTGHLPQHMCIMFCDAKSYNGYKSHNPFTFKHFKLNLLNVKINDIPVYAKPLQPNFSDGDYLREYRLLFDNCGMYHTNNVINIPMEQWKSGINIYPFDLSPEWCNLFHIHPGKAGNISVEVGFENDLSDNIYMLVYSVHTQAVLIDKDRNVTLVD